MSSLGKRIMNNNCNPNDILLYWLGGAGFVIKKGNTLIGIDIYLSDACRNERDDFKRLIPPPLEPEDIRLDYLISTHEHGDHFDVGSITKFINRETETKLICPATVAKESKKLGIASSSVIELNRNESVNLGDIKIAGVFCDHGTQSPDAIGVIIKIGGRTIYFTSDTCYRSDLYKLVPLKDNIDVLLVPINGKFGNPDSKDASYITSWVKPRIVVPCHFWLFKEHGGDPGEFIACCEEIAPDSKIAVLAIGEEFSF